MINDIEDYEYQGSPKRIYLANTVIPFVLVPVFLYTAYYYHNLFRQLEDGYEIYVMDALYFLYLLGGVWLVTFFFITVASIFVYISYHHYKKYLQVKNQKF